MIWLTICAFTVGLMDLDQGLDPAGQVAPHPVGRGDEDPRLLRRQAVAVAEADDAGVFEEPPDDRLDPDVLATGP